MTDLSIIIVGWNTRELLRHCLQSLYDTTCDLDFEVFVVDNGSTDGSPAMVHDVFPAVKLIENHANVGFARANNQAIRLSTGRYVLLLNSDTIVPVGALAELVRAADVQPDVGVVGCMLRNADNTFQASYNNFPGLVTEWLLAAGLAGKLLSPQSPSHPEADSWHSRNVDWVSGAALLARRAMLEQIGYLDEDYFMYTEEADLCWRARQASWRVFYNATVQITHLGGGSASRWTATQVKLLYTSKAIFFRKHRGLIVAMVYRLGVRLITLIKIASWHCLGVATSREHHTVLHDKILAHQPLVFGRW